MTATGAAYTAVVAYDRFAPHKKRTRKIRKQKICQSCQYVSGQFNLYRGMFLSIFFFYQNTTPGDVSCWQYNICRPRWLIRSSCGSRLRGTGFESRSGRMFVIEVVHIQFSKKLFKSVECAVLSMVLCTMKNPGSHSIRVRYCPDFGLPSVAIFPWLCRKRRKAIFTLLTIFI